VLALAEATGAAVPVAVALSALVAAGAVEAVVTGVVLAVLGAADAVLVTETTLVAAGAVLDAAGLTELAGALDCAGASRVPVPLPQARLRAPPSHKLDETKRRSRERDEGTQVQSNMMVGRLYDEPRLRNRLKLRTKSRVHVPVCHGA
jgi:hypothetical protein